MRHICLIGSKRVKNEWPEDVTFDLRHTHTIQAFPPSNSNGRLEIGAKM